MAEVVHRHTTIADLLQDGAVGQGIAHLDDRPVLGEHCADRIDTGVRVEDSSYEGHIADYVDRHTTV